jgi:hypothetical protein
MSFGLGMDSTRLTIICVTGRVGGHINISDVCSVGHVHGCISSTQVGGAQVCIGGVGGYVRIGGCVRIGGRVHGRVRIGGCVDVHVGGRIFISYKKFKKRKKKKGLPSVLSVYVKFPQWKYRCKCS